MKTGKKKNVNTNRLHHPNTEHRNINIDTNLGVHIVLSFKTVLKHAEQRTHTKQNKTKKMAIHARLNIVACKMLKQTPSKYWQNVYAYFLFYKLNCICFWIISHKFHLQLCARASKFENFCLQSVCFIIQTFKLISPSSCQFSIYFVAFVLSERHLHGFANIPNLLHCIVVVFCSRNRSNPSHIKHSNRFIVRYANVGGIVIPRSPWRHSTQYFSFHNWLKCTDQQTGNNSFSMRLYWAANHRRICKKGKYSIKRICCAAVAAVGAAAGRTLGCSTTTGRPSIVMLLWRHLHLAMLVKYTIFLISTHTQTSLWLAPQR